MAASPFSARRTALIIATSGLAFVAACDDDGNFDLDLRNLGGGFDTSQAAADLANRPAPDDRGVISYPGYQVVVAKQGETARQIATRLGLDPTALARHNGIDPDVPLRRDEIVSLPSRVAEPSPATGAVTTGPLQPPAQIDVTTLASDAIDRAGPQQPAATQPDAAAQSAQTAAEPVRHQVRRGETAYSIARLYDVPVQALGEWNGLGTDLGVREGQQLIIPVAGAAPPPRTDSATSPGTGTPTPTPPSASQPLPEDDTTSTAAETEDLPPAPDVGTAAPATSAPFILPVAGPIIRDYNPPRNEGIDIDAGADTPVKAAAQGTVAAVSETASGEQFIVMRHTGTILSVYMNLQGLTVERGDTVSQGQTIGQVSNAGFLHFEVRDGRDSVNPADYLP
ncbi:MAG: Peptidase, M23/M37 family [Rhodobacteraceae bacterium HLUCCA08]|nr:MAG: Peptidase, M23/M37 family [Rhodobacteraceae bacterium HLUCCA08]